MTSLSFRQFRSVFKKSKASFCSALRPSPVNHSPRPANLLDNPASHLDEKSITNLSANEIIKDTGLKKLHCYWKIMKATFHKSCMT